MVTGAQMMGKIIIGFMLVVVISGCSLIPGEKALMPKQQTIYNEVYAGERLNRVAFPLGGMGAGMICLEGTGAFSHFSVCNKPDMFNEPCVFSAICIRGESPTAAGSEPLPQGEENIARVLEGPVPNWKIYGNPGNANGSTGKTYGLPRFSGATFKARFPFGVVSLQDEQFPLQVEITGWSPFVPGDADNASLPVAGVEYNFKNITGRTVDAVYSFNAKNFMAVGSGDQAVRSVPDGFVLWQNGSAEKPWEQGSFCAAVIDTNVSVNYAWFRGGWFDALTIAWKNIEEGKCFAQPPITIGKPSPGATIFVPFRLAPGAEKTVRLLFSWYVPETNLRFGKDVEPPATPASRPATYKPWYSARFASIEEVNQYWRDNYDLLRQQSQHFSECFYDTTLPAEVTEAVAANLTILKSPTVLRQTDGRLWCFEGCSDTWGCCHGSCTHVWNYAQALPHLFPDLERSLRQTEFNECQDERGHQKFRAPLPIRPADHEFYAAADGQLGGIMKVYRDWRICGDTEWLRTLWHKVKASLNYCIETWDPDRNGVLIEPHHNTYDIEFWGADSMCNSFYMGSLKAFVLMGTALGDDVSEYQTLFDKGRKFLEEELYNGEYFYQRVQWKNLRAQLPTGDNYSSEALELMKTEGPRYQYGDGCLSDGILGAWMSAVCGAGEILNSEKVQSHLRSVHKYNLKKDFSEHANPQRPSFAVGKEGGLLLCTWPRGARPSLPFVYSDEVWTGIEYQVASHLFMEGMIEEGLDIVRTCRNRYDGSIRNPFDEYECGHWYARAMSSYAMLQGLTGVRYDAVEKTLYVRPRIRGDFRSFLSTATGYATVGIKNGKPFVEPKHGTIVIEKIKYEKE
jgi:uncharacterized protein (DUF608 family)